MENEFYPTGIVKIYDANTSKLISEGHNMILKAGRDYIRNVFLSMVLQGETQRTPLRNINNIDDAGFSKTGLFDFSTTSDGALSLSSIYIGSNGSATLLDGDYSINNNDVVIALTDDDISYDVINNCLKLSIKIDSDTQDTKNIIARELGIILGDSTSNNHIIFSRIAFDPISLEAGSSVNLEYYIYF